MFVITNYKVKVSLFLVLGVGIFYHSLRPTNKWLPRPRPYPSAVNRTPGRCAGIWPRPSCFRATEGNFILKKTKKNKKTERNFPGRLAVQGAADHARTYAGSILLDAALQGAKMELEVARSI